MKTIEYVMLTVSCVCARVCVCVCAAHSFVKIDGHRETPSYYVCMSSSSSFSVYQAISVSTTTRFMEVNEK